ncbi:competence/damage-inducible protein A [Govanella unica]|uniref:Molybdopterin-binding protein n=1 Tax=Govanella unica TaxID=2975056 RepID=A0A9X3TXE1_9PROT|nr:molybdopterin-binding protein [Govania unica]MDA5193454.1 molybdopterin-binding protein [Govania unica]
MTQNMAATDPVKRVTACLLIIGDEILSGRTEDANLNYLAKWLNEEGIELREVRVIPDVAEVIVPTLNAVRGAFDYVFTTGGIGPTHDDITADCVAAAFGVPLEFNAEAERQLMTRMNGPMTEGRRRMTRIPAGGRTVPNPVSGAPGIEIGNVFVLAGIPRVMQAMLEELRGRLQGGRKVQSAALHVFAGESTMAATLSLVQDRAPEVAIGSYPFVTDDSYGASLVLRSPDPVALAAALDDLRAELQKNGFTVHEGEADIHLK